MKNIDWEKYLNAIYSFWDKIKVKMPEKVSSPIDRQITKVRKLALNKQLGVWGGIAFAFIALCYLTMCTGGNNSATNATASSEDPLLAMEKKAKEMEEKIDKENFEKEYAEFKTQGFYAKIRTRDDVLKRFPKFANEQKLNNEIKEYVGSAQKFDDLVAIMETCNEPSTEKIGLNKSDAWKWALKAYKIGNADERKSMKFPSVPEGENLKSLAEIDENAFGEKYVKYLKVHSAKDYAEKILDMHKKGKLDIEKCDRDALLIVFDDMVGKDKKSALVFASKIFQYKKNKNYLLPDNIEDETQKRVSSFIFSETFSGNEDAMNIVKSISANNAEMNMFPNDQKKVAAAKIKSLTDKNEASKFLEARKIIEEFFRNKQNVSAEERSIFMSAISEKTLFGCYIKSFILTTFSPLDYNKAATLWIKIFNEKANLQVLTLIGNDKHFGDLINKIIERKTELSDKGISNLSSYIVITSPVINFDKNRAIAPAQTGNKYMYSCMANLLNARSIWEGIIEFSNRYATPSDSYAAFAEIKLSLDPVFIYKCFKNEVEAVPVTGMFTPDDLLRKKIYRFKISTQMSKIMPYINYIVKNMERDGEDILFKFIDEINSELNDATCAYDIRMAIIKNATSVKDPKLAFAIVKMATPYLNEKKCDKNLLKTYIETAANGGIKEAEELRQKLF